MNGNIIPCSLDYRCWTVGDLSSELVTVSLNSMCLVLPSYVTLGHSLHAVDFHFLDSRCGSHELLNLLEDEAYEKHKSRESLGGSAI